jgi:hypothetical protein
LDHLNAFLAQGLLHVNCVEELTGEPKKGVLWPVLEPVDCAAVYQRWEHADSGTEVVADWTEGQYDVQILLAFLHEETVKLCWSAFFQPAFVFHHWAHHFNQFSFLIRWEQVGNFISVQQIVDVFDKSLILDFTVCEQENCGLVFTA